MPSSWPVAFSMIGPSGPAGASGVGTSLTENFMVAAGVNTNKLAYSYNGTLWYPSASGNAVFTVFCSTVAWNGSVWVAGGEGTNTLAYSADGINWTGLGSSIFTSCSSLAWNGSSWLASGSGTGTTNKLAVSFDGINWTSSTADTSYSLLAWNGSLWVGASGALQYSSDGITWNFSTSGTTVFNDAANSVAWNGSLWLAGGSGTTHKLARSDDGIIWTGLATTVFTVSCRSVAWNGSLWVAGGEGTNRLAYSIDGNTWTPSLSGNSMFIDICSTVAWNGSVWIAGGLGTNTLAYSVNGITWTPLGNTIFDLGSSILASRRPLPYVGYSYAKSITDSASSAAGPVGAIQYKDTNSGLAGSSNLIHDGLSKISSGDNYIQINNNSGVMTLNALGGIVVNGSPILSAQAIKITEKLELDGFLLDSTNSSGTNGQFLGRDSTSGKVSWKTPATGSGSSTSISQAGASVECTTTGNITATAPLDRGISLTSDKDISLVATNGKVSMKSYNTYGNSHIGIDLLGNILLESGDYSKFALDGYEAGITFNNNLNIDKTGEILTFSQVGGVKAGSIVGLSTINGQAYTPGGTGSGQMVYSGTTLANVTGVSGDYFINTSSGILYKYGMISAGLATDVSTFAGNGEYGQTNSSLLNSTFWNLGNIAIDSNNNKYVIERNNANNSSNIRKIDRFGAITTFVEGLQTKYAITTDALGNIYTSANYSGGWNILKITPAASISVLFSDPSGGAWDLKFDSAGNIYCINPHSGGNIYKVTPSGEVSTFASGFYQITGGAFDSNGNLYVISQPGGTVQKITPSGTVSLFASIVPSGPTNGVFDSDNNLYITNTFYNVINKITPNGDISILAGVLETPGFLDGPKLSAKFNWPLGIALDSYGSMFITDSNRRIRTISSQPGGPGWQYIYNLNGSSASGSYPYSPATPANWTNPVPSSFGAAIDRLAAAVAGLMPSGTLP